MHIPKTSRLAVSHDEIREHVAPRIAELLKVDSKQVRISREIEFNILGYLYHPEWGETNTGEWFADRFRGATPG